MKYLSLLALLVFVSCNPPPVKVLDLSCDRQKLLSGVSAEASCEDLSQYKCDVREFSPSLASEVRKGIEYCTEEGQDCIRYDHQIFDTSDIREIDEHASAVDFEKGGQYNRQEVRCWNPQKRSPASEGASIKDALKAAYEICK